MKLYIATANHYTWDEPAVDVFPSRKEAQEWLDREKNYDPSQLDPEFFVGRIRERWIDVGVEDETHA